MCVGGGVEGASAGLLFLINGVKWNGHCYKQQSEPKCHGGHLQRVKLLRHLSPAPPQLWCIIFFSFYFIFLLILSRPTVVMFLLFFFLFQSIFQIVFRPCLSIISFPTISINGIHFELVWTGAFVNRVQNFHANALSMPQVSQWVRQSSKYFE